MSRYAYLVCLDCEVEYFLGKIIEPDDGIRYFHIGACDVPNSERREIAKVVFRFLADHMSHRIAVLPEWELEKIITDGWSWIGDEPSIENCIGIHDYIDEFRG